MLRENAVGYLEEKKLWCTEYSYSTPELYRIWRHVQSRISRSESRGQLMDSAEERMENVRHDNTL